MPKTLLYRFEFKRSKHHEDLTFLMASTVSGQFQEVRIFTEESGYNSGYMQRKAHYPAENRTCLTRWKKF